MKKFYLLILSGLFVGAAMGQSANSSTVNASKTNVKREAMVSASRISTNEIKSVDNRTKVELPGFPVYLNTGNKDLDDANYDAAKQNWINENQDIYSIFSNKGELKTTINLIDFPVYLITGNSTVDYANYKSARENWMKDNEILYFNYLNSIR